MLLSMPSATGFISEEDQQYVEEELVENGPYDSQSEVVTAAIDYFLHNKFNR